MRALMIAALAAAGLAFAPAPTAHAVSAACWAHLSKVDTAQTPAADRRFHLERGEFSPCSEADAGESSARSTTSDNRGSADEGKSRYCRKHWFC